MALVTPADVEAAAGRIAGYVRATPVVEVAAGELGLPVPATLKLELLQHTGSFKPRGAFHRVLRADVPAAGLIAAAAATTAPRSPTSPAGSGTAPRSSCPPPARR